jgi:flagella basal body P-ring formation protein FlgA
MNVMWVFYMAWLVLCRTVFSAPIDFMEEVNTQVVSEIADRLQIPESDVVIHQLGIRNVDQCRNADTVSVEIPSQEDFRGKTLVIIEGWTDGQQCGRWTVQSNIEIWTMLPVSLTSVQAGELVSIGWERGRLDQVRVPVFVNSSTDVSLNSQWISMVPLQRGDVLARTHLRRKPDMLQGDSVVVFIEKGALTIRVDGILIRDAFIGESAKVRTESLNSIIEGTLTEDGRVLLK